MGKNELQKTDAQPPAVLQGSGTSVGGELDIQIVTARRYPRSLTAYKDKALAMATLTYDVANACFYDIPRGGKTIPGKTIRLAEIVAASYGNLVITGRVVGEDDRFVYAEAAAWDLENNVRVLKSVRRRITDKYGKKYNDDMIAVTSQAAVSVAYRNAVFSVVPMALTEPMYIAARQVVGGDIKTLTQRRDATFKFLEARGVSEKRVLAVLGVTNGGPDDLTPNDMVTLQGIWTAIDQGEVTIETAFPDPKPEGKSMGEGRTEFGKNGNGKKPPKKDKPKAEVEPEPVVEPEPEPEVDPDTDALKALAQEYIDGEYDVPDEKRLRAELAQRRKAEAKKAAAKKAADDGEIDSL